MEVIYDLDKVLFPFTGEKKIWLEAFKENVKIGLRAMNVDTCFAVERRGEIRHCLECFSSSSFFK